MSIFDFLSGQFIDVIHWTDDTRDTMVWRFERQGHEIKYGAKLTVREGQAAVFVHEGQLADVFTPGLYMLETNNMPIMTTLQHWDHGFKSPFKSEIYFVNTNRFTDLKWGTKNPIILRDPEFGPTRVRSFGTYTLKNQRPGAVPDRNRRHGWRIYPRRDQLSAAQHHRAGTEPGDRRVRHSGAGHGREHCRSGQAGRQPDQRRDDGIRRHDPRALYREHLTSARGGGGSGQAHQHGCGGAIWAVTRNFRPPRQWAKRPKIRALPGAAWGPASAPGWAWRWAI